MAIAGAGCVALWLVNSPWSLYLSLDYNLDYAHAAAVANWFIKGVRPLFLNYEQWHWWSDIDAHHSLAHHSVWLAVGSYHYRTGHVNHCSLPKLDYKKHPEEMGLVPDGQPGSIGLSKYPTFADYTPI